MLLHLQFLVIWLVVLIHASSGASDSDPLPPPSMTVNLEPIKVDWESVNGTTVDVEPFEVAWEFINGTKRLIPNVTDYKLEFEASCSANYPIRWNLSGHITPFEIVKIQPAKRQIELVSGNVVSTFVIKIFIFYEGNSSSSLSVACEDVMNPERRDFVHVFMPDVTKPLVHSGKSLNLTDTAVLPCAVTNLAMPMELKMSTDSASPVTPLATSQYTYDPFIGFTLQDPVPGFYVCSTSLDSVNVQLSFSEESILRVSPSTTEIQAFTTDGVVINCTTTEPNEVQIWLFSNSNITFEYVMNETSTKVLRFKSRSIETGIFSCSTSGHLRSWNLSFIEPPELFLDNFEGEVDCLTDHRGRRVVDTVRCKDPDECRFLSRCFHEVENCNRNKAKHFHSEKVKRCWVQKRDSGASCASIPYAHLNGLAQCTVGGLRKTWQFFVSLRFRRYSDWREAPRHEIFRMDEVDPILYTDYNSTFFCEATSFLFADSLLFSLEFQNGTVVNITNEGLVSNPQIEDERKIDEFNVLGILDIELPLDAVAVYCHAPWANSTDIMSVKRNFQVRKLELPKMRHTKLNYDLVIGEGNQRLVCRADGEPPPEYRWYKDDDPVDFMNRLEYSLSVGSNGESLLEFLSVDPSEAGTYTCTAANRVGNDSSTFFVTTREPSSRATITIVVISLGILLCIIFLAFFVLLKMYRRTQMLLRQLTKEEIDDFLNGKPEFLATGQNSVDCLDFMPYDQSFEVSMDDLNLDASNYLGSGEYAFVVKGVLKSRDFPVAVKIARPVADVMYFKSLLSELKIMIFIGQHANIVSLIGAVTADIQNRSLHIIVEYCHLGSLESYLRQNKNDFRNYFGEKEALRSLNYENVLHSSMSTIDLLQWAEQIANGMAYLAEKCVVHADLAARNVLLTENKVAKVSDFGLSKKLYESGNYVKKSKVPLPWRWMALESLSTLSFSTQSDVWAYGMTLWEIFTLGDTPYPNEAWNTEFIARIVFGMRMGKPKFSSHEIYSQINACWDENPRARPSFQKLAEYFNATCQKLTADHPRHGESLYANFQS